CSAAPRCPARRWDGRSATLSSSGRGSRGFSPIPPSPSTTTRPNGPCAAWPSAARITTDRDRCAEPRSRRFSTASSSRPSSAHLSPGATSPRLRGEQSRTPAWSLCPETSSRRNLFPARQPPCIGPHCRRPAQAALHGVRRAFTLLHHPIHRREISADLPEVPYLAFGAGLRGHHLDRILVDIQTYHR